MTALAAGLVVTTRQAAAGAEEPTVQERAEAAMGSGKDYKQAWDEASRDLAPAFSPELAAKAMKVESALQAGEDYVMAWRAGRGASDGDFLPEQIARAKLAEDQMNLGTDYLAAWEAADAAQPTPMPGSESDGTVGTR